MSRVDAPSTRAVKASRDAKKRYEEAHWGHPSTVEYDWEDAPDPAGKYTEMGKLVEVAFELDYGGNAGDLEEEFGYISGFRPKKTKHFPDILCFDTTNAERLYFALSPQTKERFRKTWWLRRHPTYPLQDLAREVGGRQARWQHHDIRVQAIGLCSSVVYWTDKKGDPENSEYEHHMGEWGGVSPMLCIDKTGGLWFAGGSYTVPNEGITR